MESGSNYRQSYSSRDVDYKLVLPMRLNGGIFSPPLHSLSVGGDAMGLFPRSFWSEMGPPGIGLRLA